MKLFKKRSVLHLGTNRLETWNKTSDHKFEDFYAVLRHSVYEWGPTSSKKSACKELFYVHKESLSLPFLDFFDLITQVLRKAITPHLTSIFHNWSNMCAIGRDQDMRR
jgi:hypothetical protein